MTRESYRQFCPVAMAAETLCTRWTLLVLREFVAGSTRFNDLHRGVPRMSPSLLSKRLKELETAGIVEHATLPGSESAFEYRLTPAGRDLATVVEAVGKWGQRWIEAEPSLANLDSRLLMWDMRRNLDPTPMSDHRVVIRFDFPEQRTGRTFWLVVAPGAPVDLCAADLGFEVDLYIETDLRTMTAIWMGLTTVRQAKARDRITMLGNHGLAASMQSWLGLSPFASERKRAAG